MKQPKDVSAKIPRVIRRQLPLIITGVVVSQLLYTILFYLYRDAPSWFGLPTPSQEFCQGQDQMKCGRADLFAFQVVSGLSFLPIAMISFYSWHVAHRPFRAIPDSPEGRIYGYLPECEYMAALNLVYQIWDFLVSLTIPEFRSDPVMIAHHIAAAAVCYLCLDGYLLGRYAIFYLGLSEVSSIFLVLIDFSKYFHPIPGSMFDYVSKVSGPMFVGCFILYRVLLWWPNSFGLLADVRYVVASGRSEQLRPGRTWVLYLLLMINFPLGLLQLYWLTIIFAEARKMVGI